MKRLWAAAVILVIISQQASTASQCTSYGRFPNDEEPDCRGYTMCIDRGGGVFTQYNLACPATFVFSPLEHVCTNVTTYRCLDRPLIYDCGITGFFENPLTDECSDYIACIDSINGTITPRLFDCPPLMLFNPSVQKCVNNTEYQCLPKPNVLDWQKKTNGVEGPSKKANKAVNVSFKYGTLIFMMLFIILWK